MLQASTTHRVKFITAVILGAIALLSALYLSNQNAANQHIQAQQEVLQYLTLTNQIQNQVVKLQQLQVSDDPTANRAMLKSLSDNSANNQLVHDILQVFVVAGKTQLRHLPQVGAVIAQAF